MTPRLFAPNSYHFLYHSCLFGFSARTLLGSPVPPMVRPWERFGTSMVAGGPARTEAICPTERRVPSGVELMLQTVANRRRPARLGQLLLAALVLLAAACDSGDNPLGPSSQAGSAIFWTNATRGWSSIAIWVEGERLPGTLTKPRDSAPEDCSYNGLDAISTRRPAGTYSFRAESDRGTVWQDQVTISAGGCAPYLLSCGPDRQCGSSGEGDSSPPTTVRSRTH